VTLDQREQEDNQAYLNMLGYRGILIMVSLCANCGAYLGSKDGQGKYGISHGLCEDCKQGMLDKVEKGDKQR
jgi:hypothetical protein